MPETRSRPQQKTSLNPLHLYLSGEHWTPHARIPSSLEVCQRKRERGVHGGNEGATRALLFLKRSMTLAALPLVLKHREIRVGIDCPVLRSLQM